MIFGWFRNARRNIISRKVRCASVSFRNASNIFFTATVSPVFLSKAFHTMPYAPFPNRWLTTCSKCEKCESNWLWPQANYLSNVETVPNVVVNFSDVIFFVDFAVSVGHFLAVSWVPKPSEQCSPIETFSIDTNSPIHKYRFTSQQLVWNVPYCEWQRFSSGYSIEAVEIVSLSLLPLVDVSVSLVTSKQITIQNTISIGSNPFRPHIMNDSMLNIVGSIRCFRLCRNNITYQATNWRFLFVYD